MEGKYSTISKSASSIQCLEFWEITAVYKVNIYQNFGSVTFATFRENEPGGLSQAEVSEDPIA
jgi:hypothetical protein